jgi:hypothetical protein
MNSCAAFLKYFFFLFLFGLQPMRVNDPLTHGPVPSSARVFGSHISSTPSRCSRCAEYSSRVSDLEARLTLAKRQAQMAIDKASKDSGYMKKIFSLEEKVSSLTAKIVHNEECESFILGIVESTCEMLRCKFPFDSSFSCFFTAVFCDVLCCYRYLSGFRCRRSSGYRAKYSFRENVGRL